MKTPVRRGGLSALALVCAWAALAAAAGPAAGAGPAAPAAGDSLSQSLERLSRDPADLELRKKVIAAVLAAGAPPAMPAEAAEAKGFGDAALKAARAKADYLEAAKAYERSLALAPWAAAEYVSLADAQEKAGLFAESAASLRLYLLAAPGAADALSVSERIGALSYQAQHPAQAAAEPPPAPEAAGVSLDPKLTERLLKIEYAAGYRCGHEAPLKALRNRRPMGCDQAELDAKMWHSYEILGKRAYRVSDDGAVELWAVDGLGQVLELSGRPSGPSLKDVRWTSCRGHERCRRRAWVKVADDLSTITYSPDRPVGAPLDPHARYSYIQYRLN